VADHYSNAGGEMAVLTTPCVHIIESPGEDDIAIGRREGDTLAASLTLAGIANNYHPVATLAEFKTAFDRIAESARPRIGPATCPKRGIASFNLKSISTCHATAMTMGAGFI
jgi:hypothetical protein